ncbi:MAG: polysaccharide biosynthesis C-terminal domain-containing protein [Saprospiraceae bacterium]
MANLGLDLALIGNYESLRYLGYALTFFWINGLGNAYLRIRQQTQTPERWTVFYLLLVLLGSLLVFALFHFALPVLGESLLHTSNLAFGTAFGTFILGQLGGTVVEQEAIADQAKHRLLGFSFSSNVLQLGLFLGPLLLGWPFQFAMWGLAASAVYRLAWAFLRFMRTRSAGLPPMEERTIFWKSASGLSMYGLTVLCVMIVDHFLVTYQRDDPQAAMAIWRYGAQELPLLLGVIGGMSATALSEMRQGTAIMLQNLRRRSQKVNRLFLVIVLILCATSKWWFPMVLTENFYGAHVIFNTMLLIVPSRLIQTTPLMISLDMERQMTFTAIVEGLINVCISLVLLPSLGLLGIAIGTVVAFWFERIIYVILLSRKQQPLREYLYQSEWLVGTLLLVVVYYLQTDFSSLTF